MKKVKLGLAPTRRSIFSAPDAIKFSNLTRQRLDELGVDHILEVGPGNALSGFVKKTLPGVTCVSVETPAQLDTVLNAWKEEQ